MAAEVGEGGFSSFGAGFFEKPTGTGRELVKIGNMRWISVVVKIGRTYVSGAKGRPSMKTTAGMNCTAIESLQP